MNKQAQHLEIAAAKIEKIAGVKNQEQREELRQALNELVFKTQGEVKRDVYDLVRAIVFESDISMPAFDKIVNELRLKLKKV